MTEQERYEQIDMPFYKSEVAPVLPDEVLDFHTHISRLQDFRVVPERSSVRYMQIEEEYTAEALLKDARRIFPDRAYSAVCFGLPFPTVDMEKVNNYTAESGKRRELYPLLIAGRDLLMPRSQIEAAVRTQGFFGYKVFLNWQGSDYGDITIEDMLGPEEMSLANELNLIVLLHVPRSGRLADPEVQRGVRRLSAEYPNANIVLAHCGRAYLPDEMKSAIGSVVDLPNVYLDTTMVTDPTVLQIAFENVGPGRMIFGTDFPVATMRGRRVYVMDHWVDVVLEGYGPSGYRVASDGIRATFMAYEIVLAIRRAAEMAGITSEEMKSVFYENGMKLLRRVMNGAQMGSRDT